MIASTSAVESLDGFLSYLWLYPALMIGIATFLIGTCLASVRASDDIRRELDSAVDEWITSRKLTRATPGWAKAAQARSESAREDRATALKTGVQPTRDVDFAANVLKWIEGADSSRARLVLESAAVRRSKLSSEVVPQLHSAVDLVELRRIFDGEDSIFVRLRDWWSSRDMWAPIMSRALDYAGRGVTAGLTIGTLIGSFAGDASGVFERIVYGVSVGTLIGLAFGLVYYCAKLAPHLFNETRHPFLRTERFIWLCLSGISASAIAGAVVVSSVMR